MIIYIFLLTITTQPLISSQGFGGPGALCRHPGGRH